VPLSPLAHLSALLRIALREENLPAELLWRGAFELEIVRWGNKVILTGVLAVGIREDDPVLAEVTRRRSQAFSRPAVILAHQAAERRLIVWTPLEEGADAQEVADRLNDLLAVMEELRPALPSFQ
jgi:hypothetical protein